MAKDAKLPNTQDFSDWRTFVERRLLVAFACFGFAFLVIVGAEELHDLTGGKIPQLIEWQPKKPPFHGVQKKFPVSKSRTGYRLSPAFCLI